MKKRDLTYLILILAGTIFFLPFLGGVHLFDWDEVNFAECAREMLQTGNFLQVQIDHQPFYQKPPLFLWLQALSMSVFGIGEYGARFPNALCGILTLCVLYFWGKKWGDTQLGQFWALAYLGSVLPHLYFRSGIIDPWFNLFIFLSLATWIQYHNEGGKLRALAAGTFLGLAVLTKGPVAWLIGLLVLIGKTIWDRGRARWRAEGLGLFILSTLLVASSWFVIETLLHGPEFVQEFIRYQIKLLSTEDGGHSGFPGFHFAVALLGCFPASVLALAGMRRPPSHSGDREKELHQWMHLLLWTVLILFSIVESKIIHYSSLAYFPITWFAASYLHQLSKARGAPSRWIKTGLYAIVGIFTLALLIAPWIMKFEWFRAWPMQDPFASAVLEAEVSWSGWESLVALVWPLGLFFALRAFRQKKVFKASILLFGSSALAIAACIYLYIPRAEAYTQRAVIEFFKSKAAEDCYIYTHFKSYAHLFYARKKEHENPNYHHLDWLVNGEVDKPTYLLRKLGKTEWLPQQPQVSVVFSKNGYEAYQRR